MHAIGGVMKLLVIGLCSSVAQAALDPLTYTTFDRPQSSALAASLNAFRSTFAQPSGSSYSAIYTSLQSLTTELPVASDISRATRYLATWFPNTDSPDQLLSIISGLPLPIQTYIVDIANAENSIAAGVLRTVVVSSVDPAQATYSLFYALPTSLQALAQTDPLAAQTEIASQFRTGTPTWFTVLPTSVQQYFLSQATGPSSPSASVDFLPKPTRLFTVAGQATVNSSSTPSPAANTRLTSSSGLSAGAKAGIGVGTGIGVPLIAILLGAFFIYRRKRPRALAELPESSKPRLRMSEMSGIPAKQELAGSDPQGTTGVPQHGPQELSHENYREMYDRSA